MVTQTAVTIMTQCDLDEHSRSRIANGADDFTGFADHKMVGGEAMVDWWGLAKSFVAMVEMANTNNVSLKVSKTFFVSQRLSTGATR